VGQRAARAQSHGETRPPRHFPARTTAPLPGDGASRRGAWTSRERRHMPPIQLHCIRQRALSLGTHAAAGCTPRTKAGTYRIVLRTAPPLRRRHGRAVLGLLSSHTPAAAASGQHAPAARSPVEPPSTTCNAARPRPQPRREPPAALPRGGDGNDSRVPPPQRKPAQGPCAAARGAHVRAAWQGARPAGPGARP
jgi:hypothetical protein